MNRDTKRILNTVGTKEYEKMIQSGFRPENMTPAETVFCLNKVCGGGEESTDYREVFSEEACAEIEEFLAIAQELESISDGACEAVLRNGIVPNIENLYKLRYERESVPATGKGLHGSKTALAWAFPETKKESAEEFLARIEMQADDLSLARARWLMEKEIFLSRSNMEILEELWTMNLPLSEEDAIRFACEKVRFGEVPKEGFLTEKLRAIYDKKTEETTEPAAGCPEEGVLPVLPYEEYRRRVYLAGEEEETLRRFGIPATPNNAHAIKEIRNGDRKAFYRELSGQIGRRVLCRIAGGCNPFAGEGLGNKLREMVSSEDDFGRQLDMLSLLESEGYFERPFLWGKEIGCFRIRKDEKSVIAATSGNSFGGIVFRFDPKGGNGIIVVEKEETLAYLQESKIMEKRLSELLREQILSYTYLLHADYEYNPDFLH